MLLEGFDIDDSRDVRVFNVQTLGAQGPQMHAARIDRSRAEIVGCQLRGSEGPDFVSATDPVLTVQGQPMPGQQLTYTVTGPTGSSVTLVFGREPVVEPDGAIIEQLTTRSRTVDLGVIGTSATLQETLSPGTPLGTLFFVQAELTAPGGSLSRTNSLPIIVRQ